MFRRFTRDKEEGIQEENARYSTGEGSVEFPTGQTFFPRRVHHFVVEEPIFDSQMITSIKLEGPTHDGALTIRIDFSERASGEFIQRIMDAIVAMNKGDR